MKQVLSSVPEVCAPAQDALRVQAHMLCQDSASAKGFGCLAWPESLSVDYSMLMAQADFGLARVFCRPVLLGSQCRICP